MTFALGRSTLLGGLPSGLRAELLCAFDAIVNNYRERRWEPSELNGGKLCEVTYSILRGHVDGRYPPRAAKPKNMVDDCRALEQAPASFPRSVRIQIPRVLIALYEIRNNRGVGHVGGDVDPNHMDATVVLALAKWVLAELVRTFHQVDSTVATAAIERLVEREAPLVWEVNGARRVLSPNLSMKDKTLLLLHAGEADLSEADLVSWIEHSNPSTYRRDVLRPAHKAKLIEYDEANRRVHLSPLGVREVEERLLPLLASDPALGGP